MAEQYIVHYFDARGRAEPIRMILAYAGADWKDQRIPYTSIPGVIPPEIKAGKFNEVIILTLRYWIFSFFFFDVIRSVGTKYGNLKFSIIF